MSIPHLANLTVKTILDQKQYCFIKLILATFDSVSAGLHEIKNTTLSKITSFQD